MWGVTYNSLQSYETITTTSDLINIILYDILLYTVIYCYILLYTPRWRNVTDGSATDVACMICIVEQYIPERQVTSCTFSCASLTLYEACRSLRITSA